MKFLKTLLLALCLVPALAMAQEDAPAKKAQDSKWGVGARIGFDYGFLWGLEDDWDLGEDEDAPAGIGVTVGVQGRYEMSSFFQVVPELNFRYAKLSQEDDAYERNFTQMDLQIPVLARGIVSNRLFVELGPQIGLSVSNKVSLDGETSPAGLYDIDYSIKEDIDQSVFNLGVVLGIGANIIDRLSVDFRLFMGFMELYPDANSELIDLSGARLMTMNLGVGYWFL